MRNATAMERVNGPSTPRVESASGEMLLILSVLGSRTTRKQIRRELERRSGSAAMNVCSSARAA